MSINLTISPDFSPAKIPSWYIFNTWLQRTTGESIRLTLFDSFAQQRQAISDDKVDLIYANPYDAAMLVREKGFVALAHPGGLTDEAIVVVAAHSPVSCVEDLQPGIRVASTADPDVNMMGMIMLEPADLDQSNIQTEICSSYTLVAKQLLNGHADLGILPARAFDGLSEMVKNALRPLVRSEISVVKHMFLIGPQASASLSNLRQAIIGMDKDEKGRAILKDLGFSAWEASSQEDVEFMIDLVDTLVDH